MARQKQEVTGEGFDYDPIIARKDAEDDYKDQLESIGKVFWDTLNVLDEKKIVEPGKDNKDFITYKITVEAEVEDYTGDVSTLKVKETSTIKDGVSIEGTEEGVAYGNAPVTDGFAYVSYKGTAQGNAQKKVASKYPGKDIKWTDVKEVGNPVILINEGEGISDQTLFTSDNKIYKYKYTSQFNYKGVVGTLEVSEPLPQLPPIDKPLEVEEEVIAPENEPEIVNTPQEENKKTEEEATKKEEQQTVTDVSKSDPTITEENTDPNLKPKGQEKLAIILNKKRSELKRVLLPLIVNLATSLGIKYLGDKLSGASDTSPSCPSPDKLRELADKRNKIVDYLNKATRTIDALSKILTGIGIALGLAKTAIKTISATRTTLKTSATTVPVPQNTPDPGNSLLVAADNSKTAEEKAIKTLDKLSGVSISLGLALSLINQVLLGIIALLKPIDAKLIQCGQDSSQLLSLDPVLLSLEKTQIQVEDNNNEITYNGFILEIVEEPYTPTVNRRKGVAKNSQNIILLETPLSFTTENQVLIDQLKLLIDENNLKAY